MNKHNYNIIIMLIHFFFILFIISFSFVNSFETTGTHLIMDTWNLKIPVYDKFHLFVLDSAKQNNITILNSNYHIFKEEDQTSFTALYLLSESHLSIHTYPEHNYASIDIYTCGNVDTKKYANVLLEFLYDRDVKQKNYVIKELVRGSINDIGPINKNKLRQTYYNPNSINILYKYQSQYQYIQIFEDMYNGKTLVIDNIIQYTELNGPNYTKKMIKHIESSHKKNKNILIIGGGDGFILDHLLIHKKKYSLNRITQVDIDSEVLNATTQFFNFRSKLCNDKIVKCIYDDGARFIQNKKSEYDFVIVDSTDPAESFASVLFTEEFYRNLHNVLKPNGKMIQQMSITQEFEYSKPYYKLMQNTFKKTYFTYLNTYEFGGRTMFANGLK